VVRAGQVQRQAGRGWLERSSPVSFKSIAPDRGRDRIPGRTGRCGMHAGLSGSTRKSPDDGWPVACRQTVTGMSRSAVFCPEGAAAE